jgi:hypothetical protein
MGQTEGKRYRKVSQVCALRSAPQAGDLISSSFQARNRTRARAGEGTGAISFLTSEKRKFSNMPIG